MEYKQEKKKSMEYIMILYIKKKATKDYTKKIMADKHSAKQQHTKSAQENWKPSYTQMTNSVRKTSIRQQCSQQPKTKNKKTNPRIKPTKKVKGLQKENVNRLERELKIPEDGMAFQVHVLVGLIL